MRKPLVAGNWKMNGSRSSVAKLLEGIKSGSDEFGAIEVVVCPPYPYISQVESLLDGSPVSWGGQDLSAESSGAFTGEVAASMLLDFGCKYVIVGHSERRSLYAESDQVVAAKYLAALDSGLIPILCVGETLEERESGVTEQVVARQLDAVIDTMGVGVLAKGVVAYEPVWAIGTGVTATPEQAQDVHRFIRSRIAAQDANVAAALQILYGGSMKASNAHELLGKPDIDGGLIGGAALKSEEFLSICKAAAE
ncbi:MAG: triose-phosphate isomerase [Candidatus Polarisedimenticolaceae bacterium]|nr:triose-phosphate isomerase [Candidatus Polarisedimenticolaceae bacterium]